jgi:hypothetical protein
MIHLDRWGDRAWEDDRVHPKSQLQGMLYEAEDNLDVIKSYFLFSYLGISAERNYVD